MNFKKMERYIRVNLLGPGPRLMKKNLPGRGLTKVEKHCSILIHSSLAQCNLGEPGSAVGIATGYGLDGPGIESR